MQQNQATPLWDLLVFKQFKEAMGGRLRFTVCGGAPISFEAQEFLQTYEVFSDVAMSGSF